MTKDEELRDKKCNIFATYNTSQELSDYINSLSDTERALATTIMGITSNTVLELLAREAEAEAQA